MLSGCVRLRLRIRDRNAIQMGDFQVAVGGSSWRRVTVLAGDAITYIPSRSEALQVNDFGFELRSAVSVASSFSSCS